MHECSIEREAMKNAGIKRIDSYRDLLNELNITIINDRETIKLLREQNEKLKEQVPKDGKWVRNADGLVSCDQCGLRPLSNVLGDTMYSKFCPHCGAKMQRGEQA